MEDDLIVKVREAMIDASERGRSAPADSDERDHFMQAHFRLTEALAHIRTANDAAIRALRG